MAAEVPKYDPSAQVVYNLLGYEQPGSPSETRVKPLPKTPWTPAEKQLVKKALIIAAIAIAVLAGAAVGAGIVLGAAFIVPIVVIGIIGFVAIAAITGKKIYDKLQQGQVEGDQHSLDAVKDHFKKSYVESKQPIETEFPLQLRRGSVLMLEDGTKRRELHTLGEIRESFQENTPNLMRLTRFENFSDITGNVESNRVASLLGLSKDEKLQQSSNPGFVREIIQVPGETKTTIIFKVPCQVTNNLPGDTFGTTTGYCGFIRTITISNEDLEKLNQNNIDNISSLKVHDSFFPKQKSKHKLLQQLRYPITETQASQEGKMNVAAGRERRQTSAESRRASMANITQVQMGPAARNAQASNNPSVEAMRKNLLGSFTEDTHHDIDSDFVLSTIKRGKDYTIKRAKDQGSQKIETDVVKNLKVFINENTFGEKADVAVVSVMRLSRFENVSDLMGRFFVDPIIARPIGGGLTTEVIVGDENTTVIYSCPLELFNTDRNLVENYRGFIRTITISNKDLSNLDKTVNVPTLQVKDQILEPTRDQETLLRDMQHAKQAEPPPNDDGGEEYT